MKARVSALMDGELEGHELFEVLRALRSDPALRRQWGDFHVIGDAMRGEPGLDLDIASPVMSALEKEPAILIPATRRRPAGIGRSLLALAASVAGVAVVGWIVIGDISQGDVSPAPAPLAAASGTLVPVPAGLSAPMPPRLQEYLVAHQAHAPVTTPVGGTRYIRAVSVERSGR